MGKNKNRMGKETEPIHRATSILPRLWHHIKMGQKKKKKIVSIRKLGDIAV